MSVQLGADGFRAIVGRRVAPRHHGAAKLPCCEIGLDRSAGAIRLRQEMNVDLVGPEARRPVAQIGQIQAVGIRNRPSDI